MKKDRSVKAKVKKKKRALKASKRPFILGTKSFAKISAVEGMALTHAMTARIRTFEREETPAEERRITIIRAYRKG